MRPVEGTILTVARGAGRGGRGGRRRRSAPGGGGRGGPRRGGRRPGPDADLLPVLAQAGRGRRRGHRLPAAVRRPADRDGRPAHARPARPARRWSPAGPGRRRRRRRRRGRCGASAGLRYEVMYLLEAPDDTIPAFKEVWAGLGDSIVVVGGDGLWNCHIHTDDVGAGHRGHPRRRAPPDHPGHRPARAGRGGALGARGCRRPARPSEAPLGPTAGRPASWRWPPATASAGSSAPSASTGSSPAASP